MPVFLILHFYLIPKFVLPDNEPLNGAIRCGTGYFAIFLGCWILGALATIATHIVYFVLRKKTIKKTTTTSI
jgi:hypothetical protein